MHKHKPTRDADTVSGELIFRRMDLDDAALLAAMPSDTDAATRHEWDEEAWRVHQVRYLFVAIGAWLGRARLSLQRKRTLPHCNDGRAAAGMVISVMTCRQPLCTALLRMVRSTIMSIQLTTLPGSCHEGRSVDRDRRSAGRLAHHWCSRRRGAQSPLVTASGIHYGSAAPRARLGVRNSNVQPTV